MVTHVESCLPGLDENKLGHDQKHGRHASSCLPRLPANTPANTNDSNSRPEVCSTSSVLLSTNSVSPILGGLLKADRTFQFLAAGPPHVSSPRTFHHWPGEKRK